MPAIAEIFKALIQGLGVFFNFQASENANETNIRLAQEANASSKEQADLAYQRSLPINQVRALMDAGYSKIGALQTLNGGGSYTAAPIQSATVEPNKLDLVGLNSAMDALSSIPSSVQQYQINDLQKKDLAAQTEIRLNEDRRAQELHEFNMWRQSYDKDTALMLDNASSKVANSLIDSGTTIEDYKDFESMIRGLGLDKDRDIRNITHIARQQLEDGVRSKFDMERARQAQQNANRAAEDTHELSDLDKLLKQTDLSERQQSLVYKLGILANNLEQSNITLDNSNMDNEIKRAGFNNAKEAYEGLTAAENLANKERKDKARFRSVRSDSAAAHIGYALEWLVDKVNPLKGLLSK